MSKSLKSLLRPLAWDGTEGEGTGGDHSVSFICNHLAVVTFGYIPERKQPDACQLPADCEAKVVENFNISTWHIWRIIQILVTATRKKHKK